MTRLLALCIAVSVTSTLIGQEPSPFPGSTPARDSSLLERFLTRPPENVVRYRATRRLEAENKRFNVTGWMEVVTELSPESGFSWAILDEGGSGYIRNKVLRKTLEGEAKAVLNNDPSKAALTEANYTFTLTAPANSPAARAEEEAEEEQADGDVGPWINGDSESGLAKLFITPRRKDMLLINGALIVDADDADLVQVEGRLAKTPSFWTRSVDIVRRYARIDGVRVPVLTESTANVRIAGRSAFKMTYIYEMINGFDVAPPTGAGAPREAPLPPQGRQR